MKTAIIVGVLGVACFIPAAILGHVNGPVEVDQAVEMSAPEANQDLPINVDSVRVITLDEIVIREYRPRRPVAKKVSTPKPLECHNQASLNGGHVRICG